MSSEWILDQDIKVETKKDKSLTSFVKRNQGKWWFVLIVLLSFILYILSNIGIILSSLSLDSSQNYEFGDFTCNVTILSITVCYVLTFLIISSILVWKNEAYKDSKTCSKICGIILMILFSWILVSFFLIYVPIYYIVDCVKSKNIKETDLIQ